MASHLLNRVMICIFYSTVMSCSFLHTELIAQTKVHGSVVDFNGTPLVNANVLLLTAKDSSLVKGVMTSADGNFIIEKLAAGNYIVATTFIGYKQVYTSPFQIEGKNSVNLPPIRLSEKEVLLGKVTVTARKPLFEQAIDRMVINVANNITAAGSTALDVLERSPGITVDRHNNSISINGKNGVVLLMNGKVNYMPIASVVRMLAGMPADKLEKIELITTPPSNLDAQGNAGYINVVMKSNSEYGTNGSYTLTAGYMRGEITDGNINLNHRKGKVNLYGDYSFTRAHKKQSASFYHASTNQGKYVQNYSLSNRDAVETVHDIRAGIDYDLKKNLVIGALVSVYRRDWVMDASNSASVFNNQQLDTSIKVLIHEYHPTFSYDINLNLQRNFKAGEKLSMNVDYMHYLDVNPVTYLNSFYNREGIFLFNEQVRSEKRTPINVSVAAIDYTRKINKKIDWEAGVKATISDFTNRVQIDKLHQRGWIADDLLTGTYDLNENISAAYSSFNWILSKKIKMKTGLRYEYTNSNLGSLNQKNIVDRHYGKLFPTFFLSHTINEQQSLNLAYSRRITRPSFWNLAPFVIFVDPNTYITGNAGLQAAIIDNVNLTYSYKRKIASVFYSYEANPITNFSPKMDPKTNKQTLASENQDNSKIIGASLSIPVIIVKWWTLETNVTGTFQQLVGSYNGERIVLRNKNFTVNASQTFTLPKDFTISLSGFYRSPGIMGIFKTKAFGSLDFGVQKKMANKKSNLRLNYSNILNTMIFTRTVNLPEKNLESQMQIRFVFPGIRLTFSHNFGSDKVKSKRNRSTGTEEEKGRLKI